MSNPRRPPDPGASRDRLARALKWVGAVTSILSLLFGLYQLTTLVAAVRERHRRVQELLEIEIVQWRAAEFARAWATLDQAAKLADEGGSLATLVGRLDAVRQEVRLRQEDLGMAWLRDARPGPGRAFSDIVTPVLPVLERGLLGATGERKADLLAHLGWAEFLRFRDDGVVRAPDTRYREAVQLDPKNPYAHANLGHWILWRNGPLDAATQEFAAALGSGRAHEYVRRMQLSALRNRASDAADWEILRVVNEMRKNQEAVDETTRARVFSIYTAMVGDEPAAQKVLTVLPAADQLETFQTLFYDQNFDPAKRPSREVCLARLQEAAGRPDEALRTLLAVRAELLANRSGSLSRAINASMSRLARRPIQSSNAREDHVPFGAMVACEHLGEIRVESHHNIDAHTSNALLPVGWSWWPVRAGGG